MRTKGIVAAAALVAAGCETHGGRDCAKNEIDAGGVKTAALVASGENGFDLGRYRPVLDELQALGRACKLPAGELADLVQSVAKAEADSAVTHDELLKILVRIDEVVAYASGKPVAVPIAIDADGEPTATPREMAGDCPVPPLQTLDDFPLRPHALRGADATAISRAELVDEISQTANANLIALAQAEVAYKKKSGKFLAFAKGDAKTWKTLGVTFPRDVKHTFSAAITKEGFRILAEANLDSDTFVDRWLIDYHTKTGGCPPATALANDALNVSFEGGVPQLISKEMPQPKIKFP